MLIKEEPKFSSWIKFLMWLTDYMFYNALGGPKIIEMRIIINIFKGLTGAYVFFLMYYFDNYSTALYVYLVLHGSYGFFWVIKDVYFGDARFARKTTIASNLILIAFLLLYWMIPLPLALGWSAYQPSSMKIAFLFCLYISGLILMIGADHQKNTVLKRKKGLINDGYFSITRNPNYLGQIFIYLSFAICANHWVGYCIDAFAWFVLFNILMYLKDKTSYELKDGYKQYYKKTYRLFPKFFSNHIINFILYSSIILAFFYSELLQFFPENIQKMAQL